MTFVSYAQNHEDVLLWRALGHVPGGFYVDVGANHPSDDSVTRAFYERGWSGINIEPLAQHIAQLRAERPRDVNLQLAIGAQDGELELFDTSVRGLATASAEVAQMHARAGLTVVRMTVPMRRLDGVLAEYAPGDVHFLKIDVEGFEANVLAGMDFSRCRPWLLVVEATRPNSQTVEASWEPLVLAAGYRRVFFDGLNRYYLADEQAALARFFESPPHVFDDFESAQTHALRLSLKATEAKTEADWLRTRGQVQALQGQRQVQVQALQVQVQQLGVALTEMRASHSWRVTAPLRWLSQHVQGLRQRPRRAAAARAAAAAALQETSLRADAMARPARPRAVAAAGHFNPTVLPNWPLRPEALTLAVPGLGGRADWLRFTGHVEGHYSLAIVNRGLALALDALTGSRLTFVPFHGAPLAQATDLPAAQRAALARLLGRPVPPALTEHTVSLVHHYPLIADALPARLRLMVFFWEETLVPAQMVAHIETHFDALLAATDFVKRALRNSGCRLPIFVLPMGVDHLVGPETAPLAALTPKANTAFRFLHVSSVFQRKGIDVLLQAFLEEFAGDSGVELYIKTFANPHNQVRAQWAELSGGRADAPTVIIDETPLDDAGMLALYRSAQALVLPTRGEGFNLPAAEALALGLPVLVTGYGAHVDFCTRSTALLLPFRFAQSTSHVKAGDACWVDADMQGLREAMRQLRAEVMSDSAVLAQRRQAGVKLVREVYSWAQSARGVLACVDWLDALRARLVRPARLRLALLSPWLTRCGIAEYSHQLLGDLCTGVQPGFELQVFCDTRTKPDAAQSVYAPCWQLGSSESVGAALRLLGQSTPDLVLVQHQPSLYALTDALCEALAALHDAGAVVLLELHSTLPLLLESRLSGRAVAALQRLDRILVHQVEDLNHLLTLGLVNQVTLLAHGVVQPQPPVAGVDRASLGLGDADLVLACFGFVLPHKGIDTLVQSIQPLAQATGRRVRLLALNSVLDERSEEMLQHYQQMARDLSVDTEMVWITDFRPIERCVQLLGLADYVIYPYTDTQESASGAVTIGLAALKPVLVSPLPIFSDLAECTWRMQGGGIEAIVAAVCALLAQPEAAQALVTRQRSWLVQRDWAQVAARLAAMMEGLRMDRLAQAARPMERPVVTQAQLLVDVSELYFRDARTGIQRVVRSILGQWLAAPPAGFRVCPVVAQAGLGYRYALGWAPGQPSEDLGAQPDLAALPPVQVQAGDVFVGLDLSAHLFPQVQAELRRMRMAGARVHFVVYDIIPLLYPQYSTAGLTQAFEAWLEGLAQEADALWCISQAVAQDVQVWLTAHAPAGALPQVGYFHLGADIENSVPTLGLPDEAQQLLATMRERPYFMMVGTLEPRKGYAQTLAAFELLWHQGVEVGLVVVGKEGWNTQELASRLRNHPERGRHLFWLERASDEFLAQLYGAARCLLAASEAEGFGLPLIEAAQHSLPVLARDITVFHEVAGCHAFYFSGTTPQTLVLALRSWLMLAEVGGAPESKDMPWLTWRESAQRLLENVLRER